MTNHPAACDTCGASNSLESTYCAGCGALLATSRPVKTEPVEVVQVFYPLCYKLSAHERSYLGKLERRLRRLERKGLIRLRWGRDWALHEPYDWDWELDRIIGRGGIILLPIGSRFRHFYDNFDLMWAIERIERRKHAEVRIIPILLPGVSRQEWEQIYLREFEEALSWPRDFLKDAKPIENGDDEEKALDSVVESIHEAIREWKPDSSPPPLSPRNPDVAYSAATALPTMPLSIPLPPKPRNLRPRLLVTSSLIGIGSLILIPLIVGAIISFFHFFPLAPSAPENLGSHDLHLMPKYVKQMQVNHAYIVSVVLASSNDNVPLSAVNGSVVDGQNMPLGTLLGQEDTPCAAASLIVDQTAFRVQPSQPQEYSLEQSQITWIWSITPLRSDLQKEIPVDILFSGKSHCGSGDALTGPYLLTGNNSSLMITVEGSTSPPAQGIPFGLLILLSGLSLLLLTFLAWLNISLRRRRKKGKHSVRTLETKSSHIDLVNKPSMTSQPEVNSARIAPLDQAKHPVEARLPALVQFASPQLVQSEVQTERPQQATVNTSLSIFYCYAREDKALRDQLEKHLSPLQRSGQISDWYDGEIVPGTPWNEEITMQLNAAHIILLLISSDFIASDYCYSKEMMRAMERHQAREASVVPIILRPAVWDNMPIAGLQVLPSGGKAVSSWSNVDEAFHDVVQGIRLVVATLLTHL